MLKFPKIKQFYHICNDVKKITQFTGLDKEGNPTYKEDEPLPTLSFIGTVKLHGTNAAIGYNTLTRKLWTQSRERVITIFDDNAGFASFVKTYEEEIRELMEDWADQWELPELVVFGEWCGGNIQSGVALSQLPKMFVVFAAATDLRAHTPNETQATVWLNPDICQGGDDIGIYNINRAPKQFITIDFNKPEEAVKLLEEKTLEVENECPFAKSFGVSGVGEGIVWRGYYKNQILTFKTKGEKHSTGKKGNNKISHSPEKLKSIEEFVKFAVNPTRCRQAFFEVFKMGGHLPCKKNTGHFLKWMLKDIIEEESDILILSELSFEEIKQPLQKASREWLFKKLIEGGYEQ